MKDRGARKPDADAEEHVAELAHRGVGEHLLDVGLRHRDGGGEERGHRAHDGDGGERVGRQGVEPVQAAGQVDARRHHGGGVDERRHRRGTRHGVRKPDVERDLRRLPRGAGEQQQADERRHGPAAEDGGAQPVQVLREAGEVERPRELDQQEEPDQEAGVTDAVREHRLLAGGAVLFLGPPEADQQVGAQAHALPADEQQEQAVGEDEDQHRGDEEVQVGEVARHVRVVRHVADRVDVDQEAHAGHHQDHHGAQRIEPERDVDVQLAHMDPLEDHVVQRALRRQRVQPEHRQHARDEGREQHTRTDELRRRREPPPEEQVPQEAEPREQDDPAQRVDGHDVHHRSTVTSSALIVSRMR